MKCVGSNTPYDCRLYCRMMLAYTTKFGAFNHRFLPAALLINVHTGFTCLIEHWILYITPLELDTLTMEPRVEIGQSFTSEDFGTAVTSLDQAFHFRLSDLAGPTGKRILEESGTMGRILMTQELHPCLLRGLSQKLLLRHVNGRKEEKKKARRSLFEDWSWMYMVWSHSFN